MTASHVAVVLILCYITSITSWVMHTYSNPLLASTTYRHRLLRSFKHSSRSRFALQVYENDKFSENSMSIDEIKAELELRGVDYQDCISKNELVQRLIETRVSGKANPEILKSMKEQSDGDDILISELDDDILDQATSKDGNLPGGMSKEMLKALSSDKEIMRMLQDPKMQDIMGAVMTGGPDAIKKYMSDPDALMLLDRLSKTMSKFRN